MEAERDRRDHGDQGDRLRTIDRSRCLELLGRGSFGRIGLNVDVLPVVLPVNYCMHGDHVVVRTGRGAKVSAATHEAVVAFQVDDYDEASGLGWTVMVTGIAREVAEPDELCVGPQPAAGSWLSEEEERFVSISLDIVSGRELEAISPA